MRQKKQKYVPPTSHELGVKVLKFDRLMLGILGNEEALSRIFETPEYLEFRKAENFYHCRGLRRVNTSAHNLGLRDLETSGLLREYMNEISAIVSHDRLCLRRKNEWEYTYLSPYNRSYQEEQKKFLLSIIPFDMEAFGSVYVYTEDQRQYLFHLQASGELPEEIAGFLSHREVIVDPWVWKRRRQIIAEREA